MQYVLSIQIHQIFHSSVVADSVRAGTPAVTTRATTNLQQRDVSRRG